MTARRAIDDTHDPARVSWVESANDDASDFPIQNLPFCVFREIGDDASPRVGVGIGDRILNVGAAARAGLIPRAALTVARYCDQPTLNGLMKAGAESASHLRSALSDLLWVDGESAPRARKAAKQILVPIEDAELTLPVRIGDYTDFYASLHHATNVGRMLRPDNPLLPNYKHVPIGYHGRASSVVVSGTEIPRPRGQTRADPSVSPIFGATQRLDYEIEVGAFIGAGNMLGEPVAIENAEKQLFGLCLLNDWSARDVQTWEYQPLGPFLAKSFATSISAWVVTADALAPFRVAAFVRDVDDPSALPYLWSEQDQLSGGFDVILEVLITTEQMRAGGHPPFLVSRGSFRDMYWTIGQLIAHHTSNGCNLRPGDLLGSGTVSGASPESRGCLLERTWRGEQPLPFPTGEARAFLADGDEVVLRGYCAREGARRIGFGECRGRILSGDR